MGVIPFLFFALPAVQSSMVNDTELICQNAVVTFGVERKAYKMKYEKQVDYTIDKRFTSELNRFAVGGFK